MPVTSTESNSNGWQYAIATGLVVGAVVIVVATVTEDIITLGIGVADDAVSFAIAASLLGRAWSIIRMQQVAVKVGTGAAATGSTATVAL
jgi:hypothetical protein